MTAILPGAGDPLEDELGRVVRTLRALPPGAPADHAACALARFVRMVAGEDEESERLAARTAQFDGAWAAAVIATLVHDVLNPATMADGSSGASDGQRLALADELRRLRRELDGRGCCPGGRRTGVAPRRVDLRSSV